MPNKHRESKEGGDFAETNSSERISRPPVPLEHVRVGGAVTPRTPSAVCLLFIALNINEKDNANGALSFITTTTHQRGIARAGASACSPRPEPLSPPGLPLLPCHMTAMQSWCRAPLHSHPAAASLVSRCFCLALHIHCIHAGEVRTAKLIPLLPSHCSASLQLEGKRMPTLLRHKSKKKEKDKAAK